MPKKYRSGFERLSQFFPDTSERYSAALKAVRDGFSGFTRKDGFDATKPERLTDAQRHQIRRYYNLLSTYMEGGPVYKMPPSELPARIRKGGRKNVEAVMRAAQMPQGRKRAKYIFIKYDGETIPKVSIRNGSPVFVNDRMGYSKETIELDQFALALNPRETILGLAPLVEGARFFRIINGRHEFYNAGDLRTLARKVEELQQKYAIGTPDSWEKWLHGVAAFYSDNMKATEIVRHITDSNEKFKEKIKRENRKLKRKRK